MNNAKFAIVTGATGLIGRQICADLAQKGYDLLAVYGSDDAKADALSTEISTQSKRTVHLLKADLASPEAGQNIVREGLAKSSQIHLVVACAGLKLRKATMFTNRADMEKVFAVNTFSVMDLCRSVLRPMMRARSGRIVIIGSYAGENGLSGQTLYSASKAALSGWTKALASEVGASNITVNLISPGAIDDPSDDIYSEEDVQKATENIANRRLGTPAEVSACVTFLASDAAAYCNGTCIAVDGGARF
ncbi:MAG: SDR family NAD(P)-dependent oxidoreductase [Aestuariibacter sp.]